MVKTTELSEELSVHAYKKAKVYKGISKYFEVATEQSINRKFKEFHAVKNLKERVRKPKEIPDLARLVVKDPRITS